MLWGRYSYKPFFGLAWIFNDVLELLEDGVIHT